MGGFISDTSSLSMQHHGNVTESTNVQRNAQNQGFTPQTCTAGGTQLPKAGSHNSLEGSTVSSYYCSMNSAASSQHLNASTGSKNGTEGAINLEEAREPEGAGEPEDAGQPEELTEPEGLPEADSKQKQLTKPTESTKSKTSNHNNFVSYLRNAHFKSLSMAASQCLSATGNLVVYPQHGVVSPENVQPIAQQQNCIQAALRGIISPLGSLSPTKDIKSQQHPNHNVALEELEEGKPIEQNKNLVLPDEMVNYLNEVAELGQRPDSVISDVTSVSQYVAPISKKPVNNQRVNQQKEPCINHVSQNHTNSSQNKASPSQNWPACSPCCQKPDHPSWEANNCSNNQKLAEICQNTSSCQSNTSYNAVQSHPYNVNRNQPFISNQNQPHISNQNIPFNGNHNIPFNTNQNIPFNASQNTPLNSNQNTPLNSNQNTPLNPNQNTPFNPNRNTPFNPNQNQPFNPNQNQPFNPNQNQPFNPNQNQPFNPNQNQPFNPSQNQPFNSNQNQPFSSVNNQNQPFSSNQNLPFSSNQNHPHSLNQGQVYQNHVHNSNQNQPYKPNQGPCYNPNQNQVLNSNTSSSYSTQNSYNYQSSMHNTIQNNAAPSGTYNAAQSANYSVQTSCNTSSNALYNANYSHNNENNSTCSQGLKHEITPNHNNLPYRNQVANPNQGCNSNQVPQQQYLTPSSQISNPAMSSNNSRVVPYLNQTSNQILQNCHGNMQHAQRHQQCNNVHKIGVTAPCANSYSYSNQYPANTETSQYSGQQLSSVLSQYPAVPPIQNQKMNTNHSYNVSSNQAYDSNQALPYNPGQDPTHNSNHSQCYPSGQNQAFNSNTNQPYPTQNPYSNSQNETYNAMQNLNYNGTQNSAYVIPQTPYNSNQNASCISNQNYSYNNGHSATVYPQESNFAVPLNQSSAVGTYPNQAISPTPTMLSCSASVISHQQCIMHKEGMVGPCMNQCSCNNQYPANTETRQQLSTVQPPHYSTIPPTQNQKSANGTVLLPSAHAQNPNNYMHAGQAQGSENLRRDCSNCKLGSVQACCCSSCLNNGDEKSSSVNPLSLQNCARVDPKEIQCQNVSQSSLKGEALKRTLQYVEEQAIQSKQQPSPGCNRVTSSTGPHSPHTPSPLTQTSNMYVNDYQSEINKLIGETKYFHLSH
ncbi:hypothetical protein CEXT_426641 [Caerostris extrusa]|uniref:Uncharacterized protein n=1 Tax=Caerostris extrusa TaxID=172846 RepID=A0AAV4NLP4_CAEEX|nr:hypothetical protein CEXT_426641 [Caerostris extrusa]